MSEKKFYENSGVTYPAIREYGAWLLNAKQWKSEAKRREWFALHRPPSPPPQPTTPVPQEPPLCFWKIWSLFWSFIGVVLYVFQWIERMQPR